MYQKRNKSQKNWPIPRKGTTYVAIPTHNQTDSIPLLIVARDVLHIVRNKKELKRALQEKKILINTTPIHETNFPLSLFDTLCIPDSKKYYKTSLSTKNKIVFEEISEKDTPLKVCKVIRKYLVSNGKTQITLLHGRTLLTSEKVQTGDSVIYDHKEKAIKKIVPLKKGEHAFVMKGRRVGMTGTIEGIEVIGGKEVAKIKTADEKINVWTKNIIVIE